MLEEAIMSARETAELLLLVGRLVQAEGYDGELSPAQWMALRFFARANSFSRTPSAFAEFQATTRGTASQAIKALEAGGYLVRQRSEADGRSVTLRLTDKSNEALARDPFEVLVRAVDSLDAKEQTAMNHTLHQVLTTVAASGAHRRFGVCQDCAHLSGEMCCNPAIANPSAPQCQLLGVSIQPEDAGLLCVYFQATSEHRDGAHGSPHSQLQWSALGAGRGVSRFALSHRACPRRAPELRTDRVQALSYLCLSVAD